MGPEKAFENKVKKYLKDNGAWYVKYWGGGAFTKAGVPDILVCLHGRFLGVETKSDTGELSELQKYNLNQINDAGGCGVFLYPKYFEDFKELCNDISDHKPINRTKYTKIMKHFDLN